LFFQYSRLILFISAGVIGARPKSRVEIPEFVGANPNFDTMAAYTIDAAFIGASELIKQQNNAAGVRSGISTRDLCFSSIRG
jgi:hypothetical protein